MTLSLYFYCWLAREAAKIENFDGSFGFIDSPLAER